MAKKAEVSRKPRAITDYINDHLYGKSNKQKLADKRIKRYKNRGINKAR